MKRDAFISYSHKRDIELARALQRGLHQLARPWARRPVISVFRDTTSLSANHDLWASILKELEQTRYFVYLASPEAAESRWVRKEIRFWLDNRPLDRFLIAVSSGKVVWDREAGDFDWERTDALPDVLRGAFTTEPLWVDLTRIREGSKYSLRQAEFRDAVGTLAAPLHGVGKDALDSEDIRQHRLSVRLRRAAISALVVLLVTAVAAGGLALQQRNEALDRARTSASQALAARALETLDTDPRKAAQFALYAEKVRPTADSLQAMAATIAGNGSVERHLKPGSDEFAAFIGSRSRPPTRVAISRDGGMLAYYAAFGSGKVHLYDIRAGRHLKPLPSGHDEMVGGEFQLSADGSRLVVEGYRHRVEVWDVRGARLLRAMTMGVPDELANAQKGLRALAFSTDGSWLATAQATSGTEELQISVWNVAEGRLVHEELTGSESVRVRLAFMKDSARLLALDAAAGSVRVYDPALRSWEAGRKLTGFPSDTEQVVIEPGAGQAMVRREDGGIQVWDLGRGRPTGSRTAEAPDRIALPGPGTAFLVGAQDGEIALYDRGLGRGRILGRFSFPVQDLAISGDGGWVAAGSDDGAVSLFAAGRRGAGTALANEGGLIRGSLSDDGRFAFRSRPGEPVDLWTVGRGNTGLKRLGRIPPAAKSADGKVSPAADAIAITTDGSRAALVRGGELSFWDPRTGRRVGSSAIPGDVDSRGRGQLFFLEDDIHLVGVWDEGMLVVDSRTGEIRQVVSRDSVYYNLMVSGDRRSVVALETVSDELSVWRVAGDGRLKKIRTARVPDGSSAASISHGGEKVAVSGRDGRILFVDVGSGRITRGAVMSQSGHGPLVFSRDTRLAVRAFSTRGDVGVRFWDTGSGDVLGTWPLMSNTPGGGAARQVEEWEDRTAVQIAPAVDGGFLALGVDGSFTRHGVEPGDWRRHLCELAPDPLPKDEYDRYLGSLDVGRPCPS
ncbi:TIR domain-containing protein [Streptomyces sp. NPDC020875]|uniref:TIR domain-containing protein n=1 Tax=Streptomyces sp. NPDC020875 TaxID=3154898 RepID=UPI0033CB4A68